MIWNAAERVYARALEARARRYASGRASSVHLPRPTISVGNVTLGGTGKTPFVEFLTERLLAEGRRPAILSRGYGRHTGDPVVVSAGAGPLVPPEEGGDEPVAIARRIPRAVVVVAARRSDAARRAERLGADIFVLDDGFQHLSVERDLDLVLLDAGDPFGGGRFPPVGRLREPLSALARADAFVVTRADGPPSPDLLRVLSRANPAAPVFRARIAPVGLFDERGSRVQPPAGGFLAVCGVARPDTFAAGLARLGLHPNRSLVYRDHHRYRARDLSRIGRIAARSAAVWIATSEKDAVKLWGRLPVPVFAVRLEVEVAEASFWPFLESRIGGHTASQRAPGRA